MVSRHVCCRFKTRHLREGVVWKGEQKSDAQKQEYAKRGRHTGNVGFRVQVGYKQFLANLYPERWVFTEICYYV